jgi:hypothetical protein
MSLQIQCLQVWICTSGCRRWNIRSGIALSGKDPCPLQASDITGKGAILRSTRARKVNMEAPSLLVASGRKLHRVLMRVPRSCTGSAAD